MKYFVGRYGSNSLFRVFWAKTWDTYPFEEVVWRGDDYQEGAQVAKEANASKEGLKGG